MTVLPWQPGTTPLMLAPMQGLTNRALRAYFIEHVRPDVIFTEFMRVNTAPAGTGLTATDLRDIASEQGGVPLVVQLVGHGREALVLAARRRIRRSYGIASGCAVLRRAGIRSFMTIDRPTGRRPLLSGTGRCVTAADSA